MTVKKDGEQGVMIEFRRKPTDIKGGLDGGLLIQCSYDRNYVLIRVTRMSEGQSVSKVFSERRLVDFIKDEVGVKGGGEVVGVVDAWGGNSGG